MSVSSSVVESILSNLNGTMVRRAKSNFIAIPAEVVDGVQTYVGVKVGTLKATDTVSKQDGHILAPAFDFNSAKAEYDSWKTNFDAKASKPKKSKTADPAVQARKQARQEWMENWVTNTMEANREYTASEVFAEADPSLFPTAMMVGSALIALDGSLVEVSTGDKGKKYYTKKVVTE